LALKVDECGVLIANIAIKVFLIAAIYCSGVQVGSEPWTADAGPGTSAGASFYADSVGDRIDGKFM